MNLQHVENLFRRFKGEEVTIKTISGGVYDGIVSEITNDYISLSIKVDDGESDHVFILLHTIESVLPLNKG